MISKTKVSQRGMMLVTILMLLLLLVMLTTSMITLTSEALNITGKADKKSRALQAAEAGIEYAYYQLNAVSSWSPALVYEDIGNGQKFKIIFDGSHSKNNLTNPAPSGTTPRYSAEIICEGFYEQVGEVIGKVTLRAIFLREEIFPSSIISGGPSCYLLGYSSSYNMANSYTFQGKTPDDPGRLHCNSDINITRNYAQATMSLNEGFITTCSAVTTNLPAGMIDKKEEVPSESIPDINVASIVDNRPGTCFTPPRNFLLIGYFEYSNGNYCVPHNGPGTGYDPNKRGGPRVQGIIGFTETSLENFWDNYITCNTQTFSTSPENKYLLNYYPDLKLYTPADLCMTRSTCSDPEVPSFTLITYTLNQDIYIPATYPFFSVFKTHRALSSGINNYTVENTYMTNIKLDMNNKRIYSEKPVYMEFPITSNGTESAIISKDDVDFMHSYPLNLVVLSEKSVRLLAGDISGGSMTRTVPYKGFIYAKDDIILDKPPGSLCNSMDVIYYSITGRMACKDTLPGNFEPSTMFPATSFASWWSPGARAAYQNMSFFLQLNEYGFNASHAYHVTVGLSDDGLNNLANIRSGNFKIRKSFCEVVN